MRRIANERGVTPAQIATAWVLHAGATVAVVGYKSEAQVKDNTSAGSLELDEAEVKELDLVFQGTSSNEDRYGVNS